eukprot:1077119-Rhodomonas_salina.1
MSQERYIETLLDRFDMTACTPAITPSDPNLRLLRSHLPAVPNAVDTKYYQQMIGGLMYASMLTSQDIAGTKHLKLTYRCQTDGSGNVLVSYADVQRRRITQIACNPDTCRRVSGYVLLLNGAAISWQSVRRRQQVTALSTAEAEYLAASVAGTDVTYMCRVLSYLGYEQLAPTVFWEDNMACIYMSQTSVMHHKARHIDTRVYHLRELCKAGTMMLEKVSSAEQVADSLTKSTQHQVFVQHSDAMMGIHTSSNPGFGTSTEQWRTGDEIGDAGDEVVGHLPLSRDDRAKGPVWSVAVSGYGT